MKTKALISCANLQLMRAFVFTYAKSRFSHDIVPKGQELDLLIQYFLKMDGNEVGNSISSFFYEDLYNYFRDFPRLILELNIGPYSQSKNEVFFPNLR